MKKGIARIGIIVGVIVGAGALAALGFEYRQRQLQDQAAASVADGKRTTGVALYEGRPLNSWIEQLASPDAAARRQAASALVAMGEPAYPALAKFLNTPYKPEDRKNVALNRALDSFSELGPPAVPAMLAAIRLEKSDLRHNGGIAVLTKMGPAAFPALEKALQDPDKEARSAALAAAGFISMAGTISPALTSDLITVLKRDPDPELRSRAALTLSFLRSSSSEATSALVAALADKDEAVRVQAAYGLASAGVLSGKPVREAAMGLPVLIAALKSGKPELHFEAIMALQSLGPVAQPAMPALAELLKDPETGQEAADALAAIGGKAIPVLQQAANGSNREARNHAVQALGRLGHQGKTSASGLLADLRSPDPEVRMAAASSIQSAAPDDPRVVPALIVALKDQEKYVRERAASALTSVVSR